jgi:hypothetical protein
MKISNALFKPLKKTDLLLTGCTKIFSRKAMGYSPLYKGDLEYFICQVEEILGMERSDRYDPNEAITNQCYTVSLNYGVMRAEYDYSGDLLTSLG